MTQYTIPYGAGQAEFTIPNNLTVDVILPPVTTSLARAAIDRALKQALDQPMGGLSLENFRSAQSVAIAVNDKTRPVPYEVMLPPLLGRLETIGIPSQAITFYIATGTHTPMPQDEFSRILPEDILQKYAVVSHDCDQADNLRPVGVTTRGTQVLVNRAFYESDLKILTGNIEPHHFAGFSGGHKTAAIGLVARSTINANHAMLVDDQAMIGIFEANPLRQDIEEIGEFIGAHFALNFVLSGEHEVNHVLFGAPSLVLRAGIPLARQICQTPIGRLYDLVIASAGGHPKDINLYQAQKAMTHASLLTRKGGLIILVAACPEGPGSAAYEAYMQGAVSHEEILKKFQEDGFKVGPHKGYQIARIAQDYGLILVSQMDADRVRRLLLEPEHDVEQALGRVLPQFPSDLKIAILPHATNTIPYRQEVKL